MLTGVDVTGAPEMKPTDGTTRWQRYRESELSCLLVSSGFSSSGQGLIYEKDQILALGLLRGWVMESSAFFLSLQESWTVTGSPFSC